MCDILSIHFSSRVYNTVMYKYLIINHLRFGMLIARNCQICQIMFIRFSLSELIEPCGSSLRFL